MAKLIYSALQSLDGYIADQDGKFDWGEPDEEVHTFLNDLMRTIGTYLYGRRMYEVMIAWETLDLADQSPYMIVYSKTLEAESSARTRLERDFDPEAVRRMKVAERRHLAVAGPTLAARAFQAALVDECQLFIAPIVVGGGIQSLPDNVRLKLELLDERRFGNGMVYLCYGASR